MIVTITVPLSSIPGVEIDLAYDHEYRHPDIVPPALDHLSLQFEGEVGEDWSEGDYDAGVNEAVTPRAGIHKLSKPRLVVT